MRPTRYSLIPGEKTQGEKPFDAVQLMRGLREKLSREVEGMSYEVEKEYIRKRVRLNSTSSQDNPPETAA